MTQRVNTATSAKDTTYGGIYSSRCLVVVCGGWWFGRGGLKRTQPGVAWAGGEPHQGGWFGSFIPPNKGHRSTGLTDGQNYCVLRYGVGPTLDLKMNKMAPQVEAIAPHSQIDRTTLRIMLQVEPLLLHSRMNYTMLKGHRSTGVNHEHNYTKGGEPQLMTAPSKTEMGCFQSQMVKNGKKLK